jgi:DNA-binding IclR family transcriptional regulator
MSHSDTVRATLKGKQVMSTTILKGMQVIEYLAFAKEPKGITEIAIDIDINKSAVQRILNTFLKAGYIERAKGSRKYQLTLSMWELGSHVVSRHVARRLVHPILRYGSQTSGCTAFLTYISFPFVVYLDKIEGTFGRSNSSEPGLRIPINSTASGLASLAYLPSRMQSRIASPSYDWTGYVNFSAVEPESLHNTLKTIRKLGYSTSIGAMTRGVNAVAAPIWWQSDIPYGSIVLTANEKSMPESEFSNFGNMVLDMAEEATVALGGIEYRHAAENLKH